MTKKTGVYVEMSKRELEAYKIMKKRDSRSDREILLGRGGGLPVEHRSRGRVSTADAELKIQRDRYADYRYTIHEDGLRYLNGDVDFTAKKVVCEQCGVEFTTRRPAPGIVTCWRCGQTMRLRSEPRNWELEPETLNRPTTPENVPVNTEGNLADWTEPAVTGWDLSTFKFGKDRPSDGPPQYKKDADEAERALREQNRKRRLEWDEEHRRKIAEG